MLKKSNLTRNAKADTSRMEALNGRTNIFNVFSSEEMKVIFQYIRPYLRGIIVLIALTFALSFLEGFKTISIIAFIRSLFMKDLSGLAGLKILGRYEVGAFIIQMSKNSFIFSILLVFAVLSLLAITVKLFTFIITRRFQLTLIRNLRRDLYNKIVSFNIDFFNEAKSGELLFMISAEVNRFGNFIICTKNLISSSLTIFVFFGILFYMNPLMTAFLMVLSMLFLFFHQRIERKLKVSSWQANRCQNNLLQVFYEIVYGIKLIKLGGLENRERDEYISHHKEFEDESMKMIKLKARSDAYREGFFIFILSFFSLTFFYMKSQDIILKESAFILSYMIVLLRAVPYFSELQRSILTVVESYGPMKKIVDMLTQPIETKGPAVTVKYKTLDPIRSISINGLAFSYKDKEDVLTSIDTSFTKGKITAIVGFSGGGKSTLLDLIVGIREAKRGSILFNDKEAQLIEPNLLKKRIGYVSQEPLIFHDTIKENITFFNKDAGKNKIDEALNMASVKDFVYSLPETLNTGLGERGLTVSGGERQRLGLARVLLKDSEVLLLDEATNSLDYRTEKVVYDNLRKMKQDKIIIVVAHRLSSLVDFDEIIVLYKGRIEERGKHNELLDKKGLYYSLYRLQETKEPI